MKNTIHQDITNKIIAAIENGTAEFNMPWNHNAGLPIRAATGEPYKGINVLNLWADAQERGFSSQLWGGFGYWNSKGGTIRKGSKSSTVIHFSLKEKKNKKTGETEQIPLTRTYRVFNRDQIDNLTQDPAQSEVDAEGNIPTLQTHTDQTAQTNTTCSDQILSLANRVKANVQIGGTQACYIPSLDKIHMPAQNLFIDRKDFSADTAFASTLGHELIHWIGHPTRLDRDLKGAGSQDRESYESYESYAKEELIAELGASFLCAELRINYSGVNDHAGYIQTWLKVLKSDNTAIFKAVSLATKATEWLLA